jgi:hypothetical protein
MRSGLNSARNLCTVAHVAVLLLALAAHRRGYPDQLAFVLGFVPTWLDVVPGESIL